MLQSNKKYQRKGLYMFFTLLKCYTSNKRDTEIVWEDTWLKQDRSDGQRRLASFVERAPHEGIERVFVHAWKHARACACVWFQMSTKSHPSFPSRPSRRDGRALVSKSHNKPNPRFEGIRTHDDGGVFSRQIGHCQGMHIGFDEYFAEI